MRLNISAWAIRQPIPSIVLFIVLMLVGAISFQSLPVTRFPALKDADYGSVSLSRLFEERTGRTIEHSRQWIGAATATPDMAALLEIPAGVPVLKVSRITFVTGDEPIELVEAHFHPERYQHYNELSTRPVEVPV